MPVLFQAQSTVGLVLLLVGVGLIIVEMLLPGFGLPGIVGGAGLIVGIILYAKTLEQALLLLLMIIAALALLFFVLLRSVAKGRLSRSPIVLRDAAKDTAGYDAFLDVNSLLGTTGTALSMLRPSGVGEFDGQRLDVVTDGLFLPAGTAIRIVRIEGRRIMVEAAANERTPMD
jgi:membrane-bound ClpP family serine protease